MQGMKFLVSALTQAFSVRFLRFSGTIPTEIGNAHNLSYVRLFDNGLVGEIPSETGRIVSTKGVLGIREWSQGPYSF